MENYSAIRKNEILSSVGKWIESEIILSEINEAQKAKYHVLIHLWNRDIK
jgi:hypothetical protein